MTAEDLRYHLDVLPQGDDAYREAFLERANAYLGRVGPGSRTACRRSSDASGSSSAAAGCPSRSSWSARVPVDRLDLSRRRASQAVTLLRPARAPRRRDQRLPRPYSSFTSRPSSFVVRAL